MADFFGRVKDGLSKGVATVSTGSKTMLEKTKLNSIIKSLEDEKTQLAAILGNKIFTYCQEKAEGDIPRAEVVDICNQITNRNVQIAEHKKRIEELDIEMNQVIGNSSANITTVCACGHTNAPGAKFCAKCGNKLG